jgi:hypothetical protein
MTHDNMNLVNRRIEVLKQAPRVKRTAGAGDGNENSHTLIFSTLALQITVRFFLSDSSFDTPPRTAT